MLAGGRRPEHIRAEHTSAAEACRGKVRWSSRGFLFCCTRRLMLSVSSGRQFRGQSCKFIPNTHSSAVCESVYVCVFERYLGLQDR